MGCRMLACLRGATSLYCSSKTFRRAYACRSRGSGVPGMSHENVSYSYQRSILLLLAPTPRYTDTKAAVHSNVS